MRLIGFAAVLAGLGVAGCQTTSAPGPGLVEICDESGCRVQDSSLQTYDPNTAVPDADPNGLLPILIPEAEADPRAAHDLGIRYMRGDGIRRNPWEAIKWMRSAGERGDRRAQAALGRLYLTGLEETGADYNEAVRWLSLAAGQGDRESARLLQEAEARRADAQAWRDWQNRWLRRWTRPYWYDGGYYGYWRRGYGAYAYY